MNLLEQLQNAGIPYTENESMSRRTTFGIGGPALLRGIHALLPPVTPHPSVERTVA